MKTRVLVLGAGFGALVAEKRHFGSSRRSRWFGR
jgi:NADH dehydrogenase FAD-containing subunit